MNKIQNNINNIKKIISSNRDISILAVTKTRTLDEINSAINAGIIHIGENYVEEAYEKYPYVTCANVKKTLHRASPE